MQAAKVLAARSREYGLDAAALRALFAAVLADPKAHEDHPHAGALARAITADQRRGTGFVPRTAPAPHRVWGSGLEPEALAQMARACDLPVAVAGALMPDAHVGYGLPIGGVLATENAVIPYAVGVDIACRMRLSVLDLPPEELDHESGRDRLAAAIERETRFGVGAEFEKHREHAVLDADWSVSSVTKQHRDRAARQLGTSGSGNHFVEFGVLTIEHADQRHAPHAPGNPVHGSGWRFDLAPGRYLALLSHSGSRGVGASVCAHYSNIALTLHPELPKELAHLAWLDLSTQPGREYWDAMNLMGAYASANHECIHRHILRQLGAEAIAYVENHHNFAWKERHDPGDGRGERDLVVHRKGATPADQGVLGVIPGSMSAPGFVVRGLGSAPSLRSASHGAGRVMSRSKARDTFAWGNVRRQLDAAGVHVLSAGIDEVPGVYKDIHAVMAAQRDLVEPIARFDPRLVKMAPEGERAED
jgi:tRNA-splicing ligase RtcB (3'-phosphate/5'-hydroxy nucleic acid ligase)